MINEEILEKHNLKAVPFSCIREGETFFTASSFSHQEGIARFERIIENGCIFFVAWRDLNQGDADTYYHDKNTTVYVRRPTSEVTL